METVVQVHQLQIIDCTDRLNVKHLGALVEMEREGHGISPRFRRSRQALGWARSPTDFNFGSMGGRNHRVMVYDMGQPKSILTRLG